MQDVTHKERLISATAGLAAVLFVGWVSHLFISGPSWAVLNTSIGSAVILVFASPRSEFARPWCLVGGHVTAALIGVTCASYLTDVYVGSAVAIALSILAMFYLRCLFPPAGTCAMIPFFSDGVLDSLGYFYVVTPVLINVLLLWAFAFLVNDLWLQRGRLSDEKIRALANNEEGPEQDDIKQALESLDTYIDVSVEDLADIYQRAQRYADQRALKNKYRRR